MIVVQRSMLYLFAFILEMTFIEYKYQRGQYELKDHIYSLAILKFSAFLPIILLFGLFKEGQIRHVNFLIIGLLLVATLGIFMLGKFLNENKKRFSMYKGYVLYTFLFMLFLEVSNGIWIYIVDYLYIAYILFALIIRSKYFKGQVEWNERFLVYGVAFIIGCFDLFFIKEPHTNINYLVEMFTVGFIFIANIIEVFGQNKQMMISFSEEKRKNSEKLIKVTTKMKNMEYFDQLTGLNNKVSFKHFMDRITEENEYSASLILMDIDNFKDINNMYGLSEGDKVLNSFGDCLKKISKNEDFAYRFSGDQFGILHQYGKEETKEFAEKILNCIEEKNWYFSKYNLGVSIGITSVNSNKGYDKIYKEGELALAEAKKRGKRRYCFFKEDFMENYDEKHAMENLLLKSIENEDFEIYCQPKMDARDNSIVGGEVLIRLKNEDNEFVSPQIFIPIAEELGLISKIDRIVMRKGFLFIKRLEDLGYDLPISINVSSQEFMNYDFLRMIDKFLYEFKINPKHLIIEITENSLIENIDMGINIAQELKKRNIALSLDDFGTGYSSINYLIHLPVDEVKLDKFFTWRLEQNHKSIVFLKKIGEFLKELGMNFIIEGVETSNQLKIMTECNCFKYQGYYAYKPMDIDSFIELVNNLE